jgi:hypothetical protein
LVPYKAGIELGAGGDTILQHIEITNEPLTDVNTTPEEVEMLQLYHQKLLDVRGSKKKAVALVADLKNEMLRYPHNRVLYNYLFSALLFCDKPKEAEEVNIVLLAKFPNYFFGKLSYGTYLLELGRYKEIPGLFNNQLNLRDACPNRETFHFSEFIGFMALIGKYYIEIGEQEQAYMNYLMVDEFDDYENFLFPENFYEEVYYFVNDRVKKLVKEAKKDKKKMDELMALLMG